jgi:uncharacterized protein
MTQDWQQRIKTSYTDFMKKKIVIAGGTGFIGTFLNSKFQALGYDVIVIARSRHVLWSDHRGIVDALEGAQMLINLAGKSVDCRYNEKNKREILLSRTETTRALGQAVATCKTPPPLWINSSTATIYRHAEDRPMTETTGEIGKGFSVDVARAWEESFFDGPVDTTRKVALRIAIVLGKTGGVMKPFRNMVQFGLGGPQGSGKQMFSWIHIEDLFNIIRFIQLHPEISGVVNCAAPNPLSNNEFMRCLRTSMNVSFGLPAPRWLLEIGAKLINTETELLLKSRWVLPERLVSAGYEFQYPDIESGFNEIVAKTI